MQTIYQAGPLFSEAERQWHERLGEQLRAAGHKVIWPGALLSAEAIRAAGVNAPSLIFKTCCEAIAQCSCVVALLDGTQVDDGTAWEIGYAYAKRLPIIGIRTDSRMAGDTRYNHVNSMIEGCVKDLVYDAPNLLAVLRSYM